MLRRLWRRTAALAAPLALAICIPPLVVIAFNLHAQSAGPAHQISSERSAAPKVERKPPMARASELRSSSAQTDQLLLDRN